MKELLFSIAGGMMFGMLCYGLSFIWTYLGLALFALIAIPVLFFGVLLGAMSGMSLAGMLPFLALGFLNAVARTNLLTN